MTTNVDAGSLGWVEHRDVGVDAVGPCVVFDAKLAEMVVQTTEGYIETVACRAVVVEYEMLAKQNFRSNVELALAEQARGYHHHCSTMT